MARNRYTSQLKQEQISRQQLSERFTDFGWIPTSIQTDLGEDFIVHIFIDNEATGITFHLQEKSTSKLLELKHGDFLSYPLKVKDIKHWESYLQPVIVVVWDIKLREGRWAIIQDLVSQLDGKHMGWRLKPDTSSLSVTIPWRNTTDNTGLDILKRTIGKFYFPIISQGKQLEAQITLAFPQTSRGNQAAKGFDEFLKEGTPISIQGEYISDISYSAWWEKWLGKVPSTKMVIEMENIPVTYVAIIQIIGHDQGKSQSINTELTLLRAGSQRIRFCSSRKNIPVQCDLDLTFTPTGQKGHVTFTVASGGISVLDARQAINFINAMKEGGKIHFSFPEKEEQFTFDLPSNRTDGISEQFSSVIDKLIQIQIKTGRVFMIPEKGFTQDDWADIEELYDIVTTGHVRLTSMTISLQFKGETLKRLLLLQKEGKDAPRFRISHPDYAMNFLRCDLKLGPTIQEFHGAFSTEPADFEEIVSQVDDQTYVPVTFDDVEIVKDFPMWQKG